VEWALKGPRGSQVELTVRSQRAGVVRQRFTLE
jgi:hypothetical protein